MNLPKTTEDPPQRPLPGRVLAIDWGLARIGLALSDATRTLASPWPALHEKDKRAQIEHVVALIRDEEVAHVLVGLPLHLDGRESESTRSARRYAEKLAGLVQVPVELVDERYTSVEAEDRLREVGSWRPGGPGRRGHGSKRGPDRDKGRVDSAAAAVLLQGWLDARAAEAARGRARLETPKDRARDGHPADDGAGE